MISKMDAILAIVGPDKHFGVTAEGVLEWYEKSEEKPSEEAIQAKITELTAAEPMRELRIQRNQLLASTDWRMTTDYPYADQSQWATFRTALRDLPSTAEPTLDEQGNLTNIVWPTPPSDL